MQSNRCIVSGGSPLRLCAVARWGERHEQRARVAVGRATTFAMALLAATALTATPSGTDNHAFNLGVRLSF